MPPRWPRKPDRENDHEYRRLEDRMNFAVHVAVFAAINSGLWFFHILKPGTLMNVSTVTLIWLGALALHGIFIFAIAKYEPKTNS